jgi:hypothetical protein
LQRKELNEARLISRKQNFDDSFYRLLDFYQRNLNSISITNHENGENYQGVSALNYLQKKLTKAMNPYVTYLHEKDSRKVYEYYLFVEIQKILVRQSRYLGTLESILSLIEIGIESNDEKNTYWRVLASQITSNELKYIFYQCLVAPKGNRLRELVHSSNILVIRASELNLSVSLASIYEKAHGISLRREKSTPVLPYSRGEVRRIRKQHHEILKHRNSIQQATVVKSTQD